ncbi:MAG: hypothetical protein AAB553_00970 [Patescibacteria group bacterium]
MVELQPPSLLQNLILLFIFSLPFIALAAIVLILYKKIVSKSAHSNTKIVARFLLITIFSIFIVFQSLSLPKTINDPNELNNIVCGWPLPFIEYTSYANPPLPSTKGCGSWMSSPMDTQKTFLWGAFFINITSIFSVIWGGLYLKKKFNKSESGAKLDIGYPSNPKKF